MEATRLLLRQAGSVVVLTGASISAESGIPTFRRAAGLWSEFSPEELGTPEVFARDPGLVWEWYDWRRGLIAQADPNAGHSALAALESRIPDATLISQNVDGFHDLAESRNPEWHGDIWVLRCTSCGQQEVNRQVPLPRLPPASFCGALFRPGPAW